MRRFTPIIALAATLALVACDKKEDAPPPASGAGSTNTAPTPGAARAAAEPQKQEYGAEFCATIIPCFKKFEFVGNFVAKVSVDIEPDGSVSAVSFSGQAPKPVQTCITGEIEKITLADYNGKPGRTTCTESGQLMGGAEMVMSEWAYAERKPGEAPAGGAEAAEAAADAGAEAGEGEAAAEGEAPAVEGVEAAAEADAKKADGAG